MHDADCQHVRLKHALHAPSCTPQLINASTARPSMRDSSCTHCTAQKKKGAKKGKIEVKKELMSKLNDDEKNDLVSLEIELVQAEVEQLKKAGDKDIDDIKTLMEEVGRDSRLMPPQHHADALSFVSPGSLHLSLSLCPGPTLPCSGPSPALPCPTYSLTPAAGVHAHRPAPITLNPCPGPVTG